MDSDEVIGALRLSVVLVLLFWLYHAGHIGAVLRWE
jgi:hypothetical protein